MGRDRKDVDRVSVTRDDLVITYFRGTGAGGQKRNKTSNCVRIKHPDSGVIVEATQSRLQQENRKTALGKLAAHPLFVAWIQIQMARSRDFLVETQITSPDGREWWVPNSDPRLRVTDDELREFKNG